MLKSTLNSPPPEAAGGVCIRPAAVSDIDAMIELARRCDLAAQWSRANYEDIFAAGSLPRLAWVAESGGGGAGERLVGFLVASCAGPEWELENLAVAPEFRRRGLGRRLTGELLRQARAQAAASIFLEVRESNVAARQLYEDSGFCATGRRSGYYDAPREDAVLLRLEIAAMNSR